MFVPAGWSFGGVIAFEIAQILVVRGLKVQGVALIDSPFPSAPPLLSDILIERLPRDQEHALDSLMTALVVRQFKQSTALFEWVRTQRTRRGGIAGVFALHCGVLS